MSLYAKKTGLSICKDISEYNTMMTSFLKCVPASATKRTSCHTTDGDEDDVNRGLYFVSFVTVTDSLYFFSSYQNDTNVLTKQADACIYTNKTIDFLLTTTVIYFSLMNQIYSSVLYAFIHSFIQSGFFSFSFQKIY
jgi:hypothetical protein